MIIRLCGVKRVQGHHLFMYEPSTIAATCGNSSPNRPESPQFPSHPVDSICLIIAVVELADHTSPRRTAGAGPSSLYVVVCTNLARGPAHIANALQLTKTCLNFLLPKPKQPVLLLWRGR